MKILLFSLSILLGVTAANAQDSYPTYQATTPNNNHRLDQLFYVQPHNSYEHSNHITNWLNRGYRSLELDVVDKDQWEQDWRNGINTKGPHVTHGSIGDSNCSGSKRLGDCFDDIINWQNANSNALPLVIFVDMKSSSINSWYSQEVASLDEWIGQYLGSRLYRYSDLINHLNNYSGSNYREKLKNGGWPTIGNLRNRIIVALTGGQVGDVNARMEQALIQRWPNVNTVLCPDVDRDDPEEIDGTVDSISYSNSGYFFCANVKAGDHYHLVANRAAEYKQLMHLWSQAGDFDSTSYAATYIALAHGVTAMGWYVSESMSTSSTYFPSWASYSIPLVSVRRSLPGYFRLATYHTGGSKCLDVEGNSYHNGSDLNQYNCHWGVNQQFVYTAEGQLRPRGNNKYCVDFSSGSADNGDDMHLWDCDGGNSEKWAITPNGQFKNRDNGYSHCMDVPGSSSSNGKQLHIWSCHGNNNQRFILQPVADWNQTQF